MLNYFKCSKQGKNVSSLHVNVSLDKNVEKGDRHCLSIFCHKPAPQRLEGQLNGYAKLTLSQRLLGDERIKPGAGPIRQQLPQYFYTFETENSKDQVVVKIFGTSDALKSAIEALIVGEICTSEDFKVLPEEFYNHAQQIALGNLPKTLDYN